MRTRPGLHSLLALGLAAIPFQAFASENFLSNPTTPYPPGCATNLEASDLMPAKDSIVNEGVVQLAEADDPDQLHDVNVKIWRKGCSEPGRAILLFEMTVLNDQDGQTDAVLCPRFHANRYGVRHDLRGATEPNSWQSDGHTQRVTEGQTVTLFLDGLSVFDPNWNPDRVLTPTEYNGDFELQVIDPAGGSGFTVDIPEYRDQHHASTMPLNGRLGGTWVVPGLPHQGFEIGLEDLVLPSTPHVFLTWYTFDLDGDQLWLAGNSTFQVGDSAVSFEVLHVSGGTFMGTTEPQRTVAGTVTLRARGCNDLTIEYDLSPIGLGQGAHGLRRVASLEPQGYACRDTQARLEALSQ